MSSLNKVILLGRVGKDPEVRFTASGQAVCNFTMATSEKIKSGEERTEWHTISLFGKTAEIAGEYLTKGSQVLVEGRIQYRKWQDKEGQTKYATEILGSHMTLLGSKSDRAPRTEPTAVGNAEDIPF